MAELLLAAVEYGGYISPVKLVIFLVLFFLWLLLIGWVYRDAQEVGTKEVFWTGVVVGTGAAATIIWLVVPVFIVGMLFYLVAVGATSVSYVMHRNARVPDFNRVLTAEHIKGLLSSGTKKLDAEGGFVFITANNNEVPVPEPKTPDFFGYKAAYELFTDIKRRRASDIVFSPKPESYGVTYYVDGAGLQQPGLAKERAEYLIRFLKNLADLDAEERRKPQAGRFTIQQDEGGLDCELKTAGSTAGEQVILRQVAQHQIKKLDEMGLTAEQCQQLNKLREVKGGVFIVAGPKAASGVTTTFYALLRGHDAFLNSVSTLERQPSAELPNITQNVFALSDTGTTSYGKKLESVVRMGLDIIGVADCEDGETAQIACAAAKDAKLVYITLEADNVMRALGKWIKLVGDKNLVAETLVGISAQRLLRKLCEQCKQGYEPNRELLRKFNIPAEKAKVLYRAGKMVYNKRGKGTTCEDCQGTGFVGRTGIFETIIIDNRLREVVKQSESLSQIGTEFRRAKMIYLQEQALRMVVAGETAINEMVRVFSTKKKVKKQQ